jgi:hypothetical protein
LQQRLHPTLFIKTFELCRRFIKPAKSTKNQIQGSTFRKNETTISSNHRDLDQQLMGNAEEAQPYIGTVSIKDSKWARRVARVVAYSALP